MKPKVVILLLTLMYSLMSSAKTVNPLQYGINEAQTGEERYFTLRRCHEDAFKNGYSISYRGLARIELTIPEEASPLPLPDTTDFAGVAMVVDNQREGLALFALTGKAEQLSVDRQSLDTGNFTHIPKLSSGVRLLYIQDENPWINIRLGYNSTAVYKRRDVLVVKNGHAQNSIIMPYPTETSNPHFWYSEVSSKKKVVKNLHFVRTQTSTAITRPLYIRFMYNVEVSNVSVVTPQGVIKSDDSCFIIEDCANLTINDVTIEGTYSEERLTGYGIRLLNVYDVKFNRLKADGKWGIFGNYNVNTVQLSDCDLNRFDVHFYGKDITSIDCRYHDLYNQFASVYGHVSFKNCEFVNQRPVLIESSFNAYTPFELEWKNCTFHLGGKKNFLITLLGVPEPYNDRPELMRKCLPNIKVRNCKVYLADDLKDWYLIQTGEVKYKDSFDYISEVVVSGTKVYGNKKAAFRLSSESIRTTNRVRKRIQASLMDRTK